MEELKGERTKAENWKEGREIVVSLQGGIELNLCDLIAQSGHISRRAFL
jgi:hypothetical protein